MYPLAETGLEKMNEEQSFQNEHTYIHTFKASQVKKAGTFFFFAQHCEVKFK